MRRAVGGFGLTRLDVLLTLDTSLSTLHAERFFHVYDGPSPAVAHVLVHHSGLRGTRSRRPSLERSELAAGNRQPLLNFTRRAHRGSIHRRPRLRIAHGEIVTPIRSPAAACRSARRRRLASRPLEHRTQPGREDVEG